jgi:hypothetical protein
MFLAQDRSQRIGLRAFTERQGEVQPGHPGLDLRRARFAAVSYAGVLAVTVIGDADACPESRGRRVGMRAAWDSLRPR